MNQEERETLTQQTTQRIVACLHQRGSVEEMIRSILTGYGLAMFAAGDGMTFAFCLEQALLAVLRRQEQQP
jgi:hypothetical protein